MSDPNLRAQPHLFTLHIWAEAVGEKRVEWRGKLKYIPSGEVHYFREWDRLIEQLKGFLEQDPEC